MKKLFVPMSLMVILIFATGGIAHAKWFKKWKPKPAFQIDVVSSAPDQVTGGDARLHIKVPRRINIRKVRILVNGVDQSDHFSVLPGTRKLSGVVNGLKLGKNKVVVKQKGKRRGRPRRAKLILMNYPITGPVFSGPHQHPFICSVQREGLGQPIVDDAEQGFPVFDSEGSIMGYSQNCSADTLVQYLYKSTNGSFQPYELGMDRPPDMSQATTIDGLVVDYIVRWERGTINRFIYSIAMLAPFDTHTHELNREAWNGKLIYYFQGGVAIGHDQGDPSGSRMLYDHGLSMGYAVAYSTGTKSGTHYNLVLGGETALMVKERFIELYDAPIYTVGLGGSGGAIQQYIYAQNHPGLIDAAIPQYSYPDMVTQAIHIGDCELLEFYMDVTDGGNPRWQSWPNRTLLEGLNASDSVPNPYTQALGASECVIGWRGLSPLALNPMYGYVEGMELYEPITAVLATEWSHFGDLINIYGVGEDGYAKSSWDNVGVQYGLTSVASGEITPEEFIQLNASVGGWKNEPEMVQEGCPFYPYGCTDFTNWDPWSYRNQQHGERVEGNLDAMNAAYEAGLVFMGDIDIPVIDWRHYLEDFLDMHNSHQSFAARQRIRDARGDSDNQVIWFTDAGAGGGEFDQTPEALSVMDEWMLSIISNPKAGIADNKPALATDRCFDAGGNQIAAGEDVWNGILDDDSQGQCAEAFPVFGTSRTVAGGPFKGSIFKCHLKSVEQAIADGDYGVWEPNMLEAAALNEIFPDGVCDFSQDDVGLPIGW